MVPHISFTEMLQQAAFFIILGAAFGAWGWHKLLKKTGKIK